MSSTIPFEFGTAGRIIFGAGSVKRVGELATQFGYRVTLVTGSRERASGVMHQVDSHALQVVLVRQEPTIDLMRQAVGEARAFGCEVVIGMGGGSVLDAGKALAILLTNAGDPMDYLEGIGKGKAITEPPVPYIAIPTTAGTGSEVTMNAVLGSPEHGVKVSLRHPLMLARYAIIDPELGRSVPPEVTAASGMDALTQLIEPFTTHAANPLTDAICREGIGRVAKALPRAFRQGDDLAARGEMALGALFSGMALANAKLGAVHGLAGPFGGMFDAPHGAICARLLPYVTEMNLRAMRERDGDNPALGRYDEVARMALGSDKARADDLVTWLHDLARELAIPGLGTYGMGEGDFAALSEKAAKANSMKGNPITLTGEEMGEILAEAR